MRHVKICASLVMLVLQGLRSPNNLWVTSSTIRRPRQFRGCPGA